MQTQTINATGKRVSLTQHADKLFIDPNAKRLSVEYAKARNAWQADFKENFKMNEPMAKRMRRQMREATIEFLNGKVSKSEKTGKFIVTFPDNTVAVL